MLSRQFNNSNYNRITKIVGPIQKDSEHVTNTMFGKKQRKRKERKGKRGEKGREEKEKLFPFVWFVRRKEKGN